MYQLNDREMEYQKALAATNHFTFEELEANREGRLTEGQFGRLKSHASSIGCPVALLVVGGLMLLGGISASLQSENSDAIVVPIVVLVVGLALAAIGLKWYLKINEFIKNPKFQLQSYEGIVLKDEVEKAKIQGGSLLGDVVAQSVASAAGRENYDYFYKCDDGASFKVSRAAYDLLVESETYGVYYSFGQLLSIELIPVEVTRKRNPEPQGRQKN